MLHHLQCLVISFAIRSFPMCRDAVILNDCLWLDEVGEQNGVIVPEVVHFLFMLRIVATDSPGGEGLEQLVWEWQQFHDLFKVL